MKTGGLLVSLAAFALVGDVSTAQDEGKAVDKVKAGASVKTDDAASPEERAIAGQAEAFAKAFNAGDSKTLGQMFASDARWIACNGEVAEGREAIEREYASLFEESPGVKIEIRVDDLRVLGPDAAVEEGTSRVVPPDGAIPVVNHYAAVSIKRDGRWQLANIRETPGEVPAHDRLRALEWMEGDWVDESSDSVVESSCRWTADKQALVREFSIRSAGKVVMTGTQRIGWDPCSEQIKSWEFDSEGGHGESLWARLGDQWVVKATAVLQDGRTATATHLIVPEDSSTCRWRTTDRTIGGLAIPAADEFVMVRPAPRPKGK